jgi:spermidine/putrescine transport system ATP-binding protein
MFFKSPKKDPESETETAEFDVELRGVSKAFRGEIAVRDVDLQIAPGEFFSILGPSGCGKTTILRLIAGFEQTSAGEVLIQGKAMQRVPAHRRPVNTVFQSYALFNHLTVTENVAFGLKLQHLKRQEIQERVQEVLALVKMESFAKRLPNQLSGGQQQRVALARALVNRPTVLLLDEPLGALDLKLRKEMQLELSNLHQDLGMTFIMVTHDQEEALSLSDRIGVMRGGRIEQIGSPTEIYEHPHTPFVADFIGDTNLFMGRSSDRGSSIQVTTPEGLELVIQPRYKLPGVMPDEVVVSVRPEKIKLSLQPQVNHPNCFEGRLKNVMYKGTHAYYLVELLDGKIITVMYPKSSTNLPSPTTPIYVLWHPADGLIVWEPEEEA